jgi:thiol-disulfide isomerase/thioredoxin
MKKYFLLTLLTGMGVFATAQTVKKMKLDELTGYISKAEKPLVVSFWATWCSSCTEEIPYFISAINEKYKGEVELLLVSLDIKEYYPQKISAFAAKKNFNVPIAWLNEPNADIFCPKIDAGWSGAITSTLMVNNKKQYRKFYEQGLTLFQFEKGLKSLVE